LPWNRDEQRSEKSTFAAAPLRRDGLRVSASRENGNSQLASNCSFGMGYARRMRKQLPSNCIGLNSVRRQVSAIHCCRCDPKAVGSATPCRSTAMTETLMAGLARYKHLPTSSVSRTAVCTGLPRFVPVALRAAALHSEPRYVRMLPTSSAWACRLSCCAW
jgi:hypothetical protein